MYEMKTDTSFIVSYDDSPNDLIDKISAKLKNFGLKIEIIKEGDSFIVCDIETTE